MKYPKMENQSKKVLKIPTLQGGMNLRDALNMCQDNQLTESRNMWFNDGILKTRAGKTKLCEMNFLSDNAVGLAVKKKIHGGVFKIVDGITYNLISFLRSSPALSVLNFCLANESKILPLEPKDKATLSVEGEITNYFVIATAKQMLLFLKYLSHTEKENVYGIYRYSEQDGWSEIGEEEIYAPIIMTGCKINDTPITTPSDLLNNGAVMLEGYNLISNRYRMIYSTVNTSLFGGEISSHPMTYTLCKDTRNFIGATVTAKLTTNYGTHIHKVTIKERMGDGDLWSKEDGTPADGLYMRVLGTMLQFCDDTGSVARVTSYDYIENNLEITAYCSKSMEGMEKIFSMTQPYLFGGSSQGINGGTRLFLGGSTNENDRSLIVWSGLNNPLYFPENGEAYIGNSMSAIKGFGKQDDMLVIFKENEMYYTKQAENFESLKRKTAYYDAYFPFVQLNPVIGCMSADSIKLCRNRLVWLGQDKKLYTLKGTGQQSERNIFCVSEMINRSLKDESGLESALALDFDGHYALITNVSAYLMDYNSYGYQYIHTYQKTEDANINIPWYIWEDVRSQDTLIFNVGDKLLSITDMYDGNALKLQLSAFSGDTDNGKAVKSVVATKFFDFGSPYRYKRIESVGVSLGNTCGEPITVKFITESGEEVTEITHLDTVADSRSAGYIKSKILYPNIPSAVRFGVRFECQGDLRIEGLNITYKTLGGVR